MAQDPHGEHKHSALPYIGTYVFLFICTILTFTLAQHDFGRASFFIAMTIAFAKAMAVILFFMHLWDQKGTSRLTMAIAVLFVLLLITMSVSDVVTRFPLALPPGSFRAINVGHH